MFYCSEKFRYRANSGMSWIKAVLLSFVLIFNIAFAGETNRYALVIGNESYKIGALDNPINDAKDISRYLDELDFKVTTLLDAGSEDMENAISNFYGKIKNSKAASVFYYAGHAMQINNVNYLLPVNVKVSSENALLSSSVSLNFLLKTLHQAESRANILILDACRNNPFAISSGGSTTSAVKGLAPVEAPPGTFVAYSTEPGRVASDGKGRNGTYTKHLLRHIKTAEDIEAMFKSVRKDVMRETNQKQIPWEHSSLYSTFLFKKNDARELPTIPSF